MKIIDVFSGSGSMGKAFAEKGWEVISVHSDPMTETTIHEDILAWDYSTYPPRHFDAILARPLCTQYYCARRVTKTPHNLALADTLGQRSQEIINYLNPKVWYKGPSDGDVKTQGVYCKGSFL